MTLDELLADFALFDDWEARYQYIIELGNALPALSETEMSEQNKVRGCASQVWLICERAGDKLHFRGTSDAHIVRGLIAILLAAYSGQSAKTILARNAEELFAQLGLASHLSQQRSNGFHAMVQRIRKDAVAACSD